MTENELRQKVANIINAWVGATKGSAKHLEILEIYNTHRPLARGYTVKVTDAYCATTASAAYISRSDSEQPTGTTELTSKTPSVIVPVLSNTIQSTCASFSR